MTNWFLAPSLVALRNEMNARYPKRDKASDGAVGDTSHAARKSSHNPLWSAPGKWSGVVRAIDVDNNGRPGERTKVVADMLAAAIGDPRVWYVIWNQQIWSRTYGWKPRPYGGANPHDKHVHVSLLEEQHAWADTSPWFARPRTMELHVATINVPGSVGPEAWKRCFELVFQHGRDFAGANEIGRPGAKAMFARIAKALGREQFGTFRGPNPIVSNRARWKRTGGRTWRLHAAGASALARKWVGFNGPRYATVTTNRPVKAPFTPEVTAIQTHWVPRGKKVPAWWRKRQAERSRVIVAKLVRTHLNRGRIVLVMGDLNVERAPAITGVKWVHDRGVDKIGVACPAGVQLTKHSSAFFDAPTDHDHGVHADLTFTIGAARR